MPLAELGRLFPWQQSDVVICHQVTNLRKFRALLVVLRF